MTDYYTVVAGLASGLWWLWLFGGVFLVACVFVAGLCRAAGRPMPPTTGLDGDWLDDYGPRVMYGADDLPIFDATIAHIAKYAAIDLDREWAELDGGAS